MRGTYGVFFQQESYWDFDGKQVKDLETAKRFAFEIFDDKHQTLYERNSWWLYDED